VPLSINLTAAYTVCNHPSLKHNVPSGMYTHQYQNVLGPSQLPGPTVAECQRHNLQRNDYIQYNTIQYYDRSIENGAHFVLYKAELNEMMGRA